MVVALHVLEHLEKPATDVRVLARIARRFLVLAVPNLAVPWRVQLGRRLRNRHVNLGHVQGWDFPHFLNFAQSVCGLHVIRFEPDVVIVPFVSSFLHRLRVGRLVEEQVLPKWFPFLSHSIIALCRPPFADDDGLESS